MKKILSILAILTILSSCKDLLSDVNNKEDLIEVKLSLTGEVTVKEEPLTKAFDSNDLIAIQVYQDGSPYAYGLFDDISNLNIYLHSGESYSFKALVANKESRIWWKDAQKSYLLFQKLSYIFSILSGKFDYIQNSYLQMSRINEFEGTTYYGEFSVSNITGNDNTLPIEMKHLVYGLQCNVTGVTDGTASITIKNGDNVLLEKTDISGEYHSDNLLFSCSSLYDAWQYADNYTENVTVSMNWLRGVGVSQDLGSQVVQVKRNCKNVINISLSTSLSSPAVIVNQSE